ncbi:Nn.00g070890.m01.CDS01 [Neocucurbitaria sp. VM-36]
MSPRSDPNPYDMEILEFLTTYKRLEIRQQYEQLMTLTRKACENLLKDMDIKGVVQGRTKEYASLGKKLKDMKEEHDFRVWLSEGKDISKYHEMGDLAGVRIGLYLPNDILKVAEEIEKRFNRIHLFGTVTGGRDTTRGRNLDIQQHMNGPFRSSGPNGVDEYWEHYGYKSWQIVVEWKTPPLEGPKTPRVEIQVGTLVTHAWAEVQHSILYKRPADIKTTPTMKRMIDAINGMTITTEIMLRELERSLEKAKQEAIDQDNSSSHVALGL